MSEKRVERNHCQSSPEGIRKAYVAPAADWHDLRVITLGGTTGEGDSGAEGSQVFGTGGGSGSLYDESSEDYDNYV